MAIPSWDSGGVGPELTELSPWDTLVLGGIKLPGRARVRSARGRKHDYKKAPGKHMGTFTDLGSEPAEIDITITLWTPEQMQKLIKALDAVFAVPTQSRPKQNTSAATPGPYVDQRASSATASSTDQLLQQVNAGQLRTDTAVESPYPDAFGTDTQTGNYLGFLNQQNAQAGASSQEKQQQADEEETVQPLSISHPSLARLRVRTVIIIREEGFQPGSEKGTFEWRARAVEWMPPAKTQKKILGTPTGTKANPAAVPVSPDLPLSSPSSTDVGP